MKAIIIEIKDSEDAKFWLKLAKKTGTRAAKINTDDMEDARLADLIEKGIQTKSVNRQSILSALENKDEK